MNSCEFLYAGVIVRHVIAPSRQQRNTAYNEVQDATQGQIARKLNMQPGDAASHEAEAKAYFDSLRQPFEQTLDVIRKNRPKFVVRMALLVALIGICAIPFASLRVVTYVFHQNTYVLFGKPHPITETAGFIIAWCLIGTMMLFSVVHSIAQTSELRSAIRPLSQRVMIFALSYAIVRELESIQRTNLPLHRQSALELWGKLLTYLRWTLQDISGETAHFHGPPPSEYPVAPHAETFAKALSWNETRKTEYGVIVALNNLHSKVSPRLQKDRDYRDLSRLREMFRGIGNFFYTTIVRSRYEDEGQISWGYGELLRAAEIVNNFSPIMEPQGPQRVPFLSAKVFTHNNIAVAFLAWWIVFQTLFVIVLSIVFRFFPTLTMNSQAMVALIAAPVAAAISMVGISRKGS